eukprot:m.15809 g.15809  ORF g.15809 m.15809 type:complete len:161 (-) comp3070_c0_seq1:126-608(-)
MGCGSSKDTTAVAANAPAPAPAPAEAKPAAAKAAPAKAAKNAASPPKKEVKKAEAFEISVDDNRTGSGRAPARLEEQKKGKDKKKLTAEDIEAKTKAAEERRQAAQVDKLAKIAEQSGGGDSDKSEHQLREELRKKVEKSEAKSKARHRAAIEEAAKLDS